MSKKIFPAFYPWNPVDLPVFRCFGGSGKTGDLAPGLSAFLSPIHRSFTDSLKHRAAKPQPKHRTAGNRFMVFRPRIAVE
jgi:hypothetical protein